MSLFEKTNSRYQYQLPVVLSVYRRFPNSPEHKGDFQYAEDIAIPNPIEVETVIFAPQSGVVWAFALGNTIWGAKPEYKRYLNWINVYVGHDEFYEIAHVSPLPNNKIRFGQKILKGEPILMAALNGYITETNGVPDSHVHILVGRWLNKGRTKFTSLRIRWET